MNAITRRRNKKIIFNTIISKENIKKLGGIHYVENLINNEIKSLLNFILWCDNCKSKEITGNYDRCHGCKFFFTEKTNKDNLFIQ